MNRPTWIPVFLLLTIPLGAMADGAADIVALETRCEQEREGEIAPLREAEIRKCKTEKKEAEYCEKYWADYGNAVPNPTGGMMPRLFGDLPSCIAAFKARQDFELKGH